MAQNNNRYSESCHLGWSQSGLRQNLEICELFDSTLIDMEASDQTLGYVLWDSTWNYLQ